MPSTPKTKFEQRLVDTAKENLEAMPAPPRETKLLSVRETIQALTPAIAKLMRKGHSRATILELLLEQGIACSAATFRSVYRVPKPRRRDGKRARSGASRSAPATPPGDSRPATVAGAARIEPPKALPSVSTGKPPSAGNGVSCAGGSQAEGSETGRGHVDGAASPSARRPIG